MAVYLVIFGAAVREDLTPSGSLERRVRVALAFASGLTRPMFLGTGGVGRYGPSEASVIRDLLLRAGVPAERILVEDRARDTLESVRNCDSILAGRGDVECVAPCTSLYHVPRCALLFRLLGYRVRIPPTQDDRSHLGLRKWLYFILKEVVALPYDAVLLLLGRAGKTIGRDRPC